MADLRDIIPNKIIENIAGAIVVVEKHNDPDVEKFRLKTCHSCSFYDDANDACKDCGCNITAKAKALTNYTNKLDKEQTHCPQGKWNDLHIANFYRAKKGKPLIKINK